MPLNITSKNQKLTRTIGNSFSAERERRKLSITQVAAKTKIKANYLESMEKGDFSVFTSEVYSRQFVKSYARFLDLDIEKVLAMYRRETDVSREKPSQNRNKKKVSPRLKSLRNIINSPKFLILLGLSIVGIFSGIYIVGQLQALFSPPSLELFSPVEITADFDGDIFVAGNSFRIEGETDPQTIITFNSEILGLEPGNLFSTPEIPMKDSQVVIILTATNQFGQVSTIRLNVQKGSTGVADVNKMSVLVEVKDEATAFLARADGKIVFNDRGFVGDLIQIDAENILEIESETPYNLAVTINGEVYEFTERNKIWELIDGNILEKTVSQ